MRESRSDADDAGLSLLEVVIAMLLFAVLAMAILPLALRATTLSATNRDTAAATAFASARLAEVRAAFPDDADLTSCATLRSSAARTADADPAGTGLVADTAAASCPASGAGAYPATVTVTVTVRDPRSSDPTAAVAQLATKILVLAP